MSSLLAKYLPRNSANTNSKVLAPFKSSPSPSVISSTSSNVSTSTYSSSQSFNKNKNKKFNGFNVTVSDASKMTKSESLINSIMHTTSKSGKISKRKVEKSSNINLNSIQCFNLNEKEKFRQLIAQNCQPTAKFTNKNELPQIQMASKNCYKSYIHSSPTKVRDDNTFETKNLFKNDLHIPVSNLVSPHNTTKVSGSYTRRISFSLDSRPTDSNIKQQSNSILKNTSNNLLNRSTSNKSIVEIDISSNSTPVNQTRHVIKSAQKRANTQQFDENMNDSRSVSSIENLKKETKDYYALTDQSMNGQNGSRHTNRPMNSVEMNINERLFRNDTVLDKISNKSNAKLSVVLLEEERYKLKKRQRLEKDKIEKELAFKFSKQLYLDIAKTTSVYFPEEQPVEIEDEFPKLTREQEMLIDNALISSPHDEALANAFNISITRKDIQTLRGLNWLNDEIINFYMSLIAERSKQAEIKIHTFTTFFYPKLKKDGFQSLKRWTRKVDIFSYDLILIPIHLGLHWTLAVIDFTCKEIRYYDSMNGNNNECLKALKIYLKEEHSDKKSASQLDLTAWNCIHVKDVPQQMNGSDCGMFACKYAEFASRGKTVFNFNQSHMPYFRRRMIWEIINKELL